MKVLILDAVTTKIVSMVYSQTQILEQEIYLVKDISTPPNKDDVHHMKATVFVQPTKANIKFLEEELARGSYSEYHIFFSNVLSRENLVKLARADSRELVRQVQEYYADYMAINEDFYQLGAENSLCLSKASRSLERSDYERNVQGILSALLSFKRCPSQIRYQVTSDLAQRIASSVSMVTGDRQVFDFPRQEGPMLLILDRRDDPITPLLTQWTYQAMVHELLGLNDNRVNLKHLQPKSEGKGKGAPKDDPVITEAVLSCTQDKFFAKHRYSNFGDLGAAVNDLLADYQKLTKSNEKMSSIEDMKKVMEKMPEYRAKSLNVSKHVAILSELARMVDKNQLLVISSLEQEIACSYDHSTHKRELFDIIAKEGVKDADKLRLAALFIIRYESYNEIGAIKKCLQQQNITSSELSTLDAILEYAGESKRAPGLFTQGSIVTKFSKVFNQSAEVQNVYTQHQPLLSNTLDSILKGKFKDSAFPLVNPSTANKPSDIFVFMVGGSTYEEAAKVAEFNAANPSMRVVLGGSCIHNSTSFLKEVTANFC